MDKQVAGFKFGIHRTKLIRSCGQITHNGRVYKLALVEADGALYYALRLYNARSKFIKQFMFEPSLLNLMITLLISEDNRRRIASIARAGF